MGTTSQKLTYLNETKQELKQKINNLGGEITDETTFREYTNQLQEVYDRLPKTEYQEGSNITLSNTLKGKLDFEDGIVGIGDTSQKSYEGYNLCEAKMPTTTATQGITFTNNGDGTYTVSGTNSSETSVTFRINQSTQIGGDNLQNYEDGTYTLDLGIADANMGISLMQNVSWTTYLGTGYGTRLVSRAITNATNTFIYVAVKANASFSTPVTIKPMFVKGSYTTSTIPVFEKYTGGIPSPNPSYPQDIEVVRGKNVVDWANINYSSQNGASVTRTDSEYSVICGTSQFGFAQFTQEYLKLKPNTNYVFIAKVKSTSVEAGSVIRVNPLMSVSGSEIYSNRATSGNIAKIAFTTPSTIPNNAAVGLYPYKASESATYTDIMICEGTDVNTSYLPYNTIEVKARGKNLFDEKTMLPASRVINGITYTNNGDGTFNVSGTATSGFFVFNISVRSLLENGKKYGLYSSKEYNNPNFNYTIAFTGNSTRYVLANANPAEYDEQKTEAKLSLWVDNGVTLNATNVKTIIYESDTIDTNYEPYYTPQIKQLSLGDIELCKIGNYVDTIEYDVENDKVYKNKKIGKVVLNGTETWTKGETEQYRRFSTSNISTLKQTTGRIECLSNYFKYDYSATGHNVGTIFTYWTENGSIFVYPETTITTAEQLKTWLSTHNTIVYFILETPTKTEITGTLKDQIKELYNLMSYNGTTIIEINGNLPMIIKVRALKGN